VRALDDVSLTLDAGECSRWWAKTAREIDAGQES